MPCNLTVWYLLFLNKHDDDDDDNNNNDDDDELLCEFSLS